MADYSLSPSSSGSCIFQLSESHLSPASHQVFPRWTETRLSWLQPLLVSQAVCPTAGAIWRLSAKTAAHELSSSWKRRIGSWHHSFALQRTDAVHGSFVRERVPSFIWRVPKCSFSAADPPNHKVPLFACWHGSLVKVQLSLQAEEGFLVLSEKSDEILSCPRWAWVSNLPHVAERCYKGQVCAEIQGVCASLFAVNFKLLLTPELTLPWAVTCLSQLVDALRGTWSLTLPYQAWIWDRKAAQECDVQLGTPQQGTCQAGLCVEKGIRGILAASGRFFRKQVMFKKCDHFLFWWHASWTATLKLKCSCRRVSIKVSSLSDYSCVPCGFRSRAEL